MSAEAHGFLGGGGEQGGQESRELEGRGRIDAGGQARLVASLRCSGEGRAVAAFIPRLLARAQRRLGAGRVSSGGACRVRHSAGSLAPCPLAALPPSYTTGATPTGWV